MKVSIIIPCKARLDHLKQSVPLALQQTHHDLEVIVVDYNCPEGSGAWCEATHPKVRVVRCDVPAGEWNINRCRNDGIRAATGEMFLLIDVDTLLEPDCVEQNLPRITETVSGFYRGNLMMLKHICYRVGGYNELHVHGYGWDETEFHSRMRKSGLTAFEMVGMKCMDHDNEMRYRFQKLPVNLSVYRNQMVVKHQGL